MIDIRRNCFTKLGSFWYDKNLQISLSQTTLGGTFKFFTSREKYACYIAVRLHRENVLFNNTLRWKYFLLDIRWWSHVSWPAGRPTLFEYFVSREQSYRVEFFLHKHFTNFSNAPDNFLWRLRNSKVISMVLTW